MTETPKAYINRIGLAVPDHDIHDGFIGHARSMLAGDRERRLFDRAARRSGIAHRFSHMPVAAIGSPAVDVAGFYRYGAFPSTGARMQHYAPQALHLAEKAIAELDLGAAVSEITHLIVASCTGFSAVRRQRP